MQNTGYMQKIVGAAQSINGGYGEQIKVQAAQAQGLQPQIRQPEVEEWLNRLCSNLESLEKAAMHHIDRLASVSRNVGKDESTKGEPEPQLVPLASTLYGLSTRIGRLANLLSDATENLEIP